MGFVSHVCKKNNIKLLSFQAAGVTGEKGGGCVVLPEIAGNLVLYDDNVGRVEKNHIVLHEIGHILLGHLDNDLNNEANEMEANIFAAVILAHTLYEEYKEENKKVPATDQSTQGTINI